ncbi:hypothetical protein OPIT5_27110 [Opitutaceae bacterium TAV5]|nr:hypothetical protein OPIT5_27110 [Opitutaceae bacterium TAV5]
MRIPGKLSRLAVLPAALVVLATALPAQDGLISDQVVGYLPAVIRAGTGTTKTWTVLSLPLTITPGTQITGRITALTANTLTDAGADWSAGAWSTPAAPWFIRITSGASAGRSFLVSTTTPSTATTLTLDESGTADLTTLSIATGEEGDTFGILAAETLSTLFPAGSGVLGGSDVDNSDVLQIIRSGISITFYYDALAGHWIEAASGADASDTVIPPDSALLYGRLANTPINLTLAGAVQGDDRRAGVKSSGLTLLSNAWPVPVTLAESGIQNLPGWVSASSPSSADQVQILASGVWKKYFHDGTRWRQATLGNPVKDTEIIPAAAGVLINRTGSTAGSVIFHQTAPYN